jgi:D-galactarolactone cycloisomerase
MKIAKLVAYPTSMPLPHDYSLRAGPFTFSGARSAIIVKITTEDGIVGWGEAMSARSPRAIASLINKTFAGFIIGEDAASVVSIWDHAYSRFLRTSGADAASAIALSGIDMALWDIRGKAVGWPLYRLLGGSSQPIPAYAGGLSLGYQETEKLVEEAIGLVEKGYRALKLRGGDTPARDIERATAVRNALPADITLMMDANTLYSLEDARFVMPRLADLGFLWLEEPFPPQQLLAYRRARDFGRIALAAGENHFLRYDFQVLLDQHLVSYVQPDVSKCGGITEMIRIAALASVHKVPLSPHSATTGLNYAASIHVLAAVDNPGWFEADASTVNPFHHDIGSSPYQLDQNGQVRPLEKPGIGVEIDEDLILANILAD